MVGTALQTRRPSFGAMMEEDTVMEDAVAEPDSASTANTTHELEENSKGFPLFDFPRELRDHVYDHALLPRTTFSLPATEKSVCAHSNHAAQTPTSTLPPNFFGPPPSGFLSSSMAFNTTAFPTVNPIPSTLILPTLVGPISVPSAREEQSSRATQPHPKLTTAVAFKPCTNLLLANKTIMDEYQQRARLAMTLVLTDNEDYNLERIHLPTKVKHVFWARIRIILFCHTCRYCEHKPHTDDSTCQASTEISDHQRWITHLLKQLSHLRALELQVYLHIPGWDIADKQAMPCEAVVEKKIKILYELKKLKKLTLCKYDVSAKPDFSGPKIVMLEWTPAEGEKKVVPKKVEAATQADDPMVEDEPEDSDEQGQA